MQSLHDALQVIARAAGLASLDFGANGFAELVIGDGVLSIYIGRAEESQIELSARIRAFDGPVTPALALLLLAENGRRTFGRFGVEGDRTVVLGHRIEVGLATPESLLADLNAFLREVVRLERGEAAALKARAERHTGGAFVPEDMLLRL
jgi:hypothetical protein